MLDKNIITLNNKSFSNKNEKEKPMNFLSMPFTYTSLFECRNWLFETSAQSEYTLIPRTNIRVFAIHVDLRMDVSQRQHTRVFYHGDRARNNYMMDNNSVDDLHIATNNGNAERVQVLIQSNKDLIWHKDSEGNLPLHLAVAKGHKRVALDLIREYPKGSYALNQSEKSPLYMATVKGHTDLVESMLEHLAGDVKAITHLKEGQSIIFAAITAQSKEMVEIILKHQPKLIKCTDEQGWTPLSYAAYNGLVDIVDFLLKTFPDIVRKDLSYPIHKASLGGHVTVLEMFYSHSPKFFTKPDQNGLTILHLAAKEPHNNLKNVVSYLLSLQERPKLVKMKDETNRTALDLARNSQNHEVIELFQQNMGHGT